MILLNSKKINIFGPKDKINKNICKCVKQLEEEISEYEEALNYGYLICPDCNSDKLISYGTYERNVVIASVTYKIKIKRVMCKGCGITHAIIPSFLKPYFQYESSFIDFIIVLVFGRNKKNKIITETLEISRQLIRKWKKRFEEHKTRILTYKNIEFKKLIYEIFKDEFNNEYYRKNKLVYFSNVTNITFS